MGIGSFDFNDVVDEAVERSGGQEATAADIVRIRRGLRLLTERWLAQGFNTWRIGQQAYGASGQARAISLPSTVDDVIQVNVIRSGHTETPLMRISPVQYAQLTNKDLQGLPSQYYLDRKDSPNLYIFPTGLADGTTNVIVYFVQRPEDYDRYGDTTDDVPGRWLEALVSGLALDLARKRPPFNEALIQRLKTEAAEVEDLAQRADRGRQRYRYRINTRFRS
jgi:hypothetical protein